VTLVKLAGVRLGYGARTVLERVDLEVHAGDFLAIVGPNGSGKTTILRAILGVLPPLAGELIAPRSCGYAPQRRALDPIYPFTVGEIVGMGLQGERGPLRPLRKREHERILRALTDCGIPHLVDRAFRELSGGQQQRALVARALVADPGLLVLDEPTNDLDLAGERDVMELVASLNRAGRTVVMVSHLLNVVAHYATRVAILHGGRLEVGPADQVLTSERLTALYGMPVVVADVQGRRAVLPARGNA
jgi:ABC-type Mn2+/Zn2+ transport system ATPase subunit